MNRLKDPKNRPIKNPKTKIKGICFLIHRKFDNNDVKETICSTRNREIATVITSTLTNISSELKKLAALGFTLEDLLNYNDFGDYFMIEEVKDLKVLKEKSRE